MLLWTYPIFLFTFSKKQSPGSQTDPGNLDSKRDFRPSNTASGPAANPATQPQVPDIGRKPGAAAKGNILTLAELETFTSFGTTRFLSFNHTRVTSQKAFCLQRGTVFGIDGAQSAGDAQTQSFHLAADTTAVQVSLHVELVQRTCHLKSLVSHILQHGRGEIGFIILTVYHDISASGRQIHASHSGLSSTCFICNFHDYLRSLTLIGSGFCA